MTPEGRVKQKVKEQLNKLKPDLWYYCAQDRFTCGIPDIIGCYKGKMFALEIKKSEGDKPSGIQEYTLGLIGNAGGKVKVLWNSNDLMVFIQNL